MGKWLKRDGATFTGALKILAPSGAIGVLSIKGRIQSRDCYGEWLSFLQPARDMLEQNLQLFRSLDDGEMYIRACEDIPRGETLTGWYEDSLALEMNIPYLTPLHIRGIREYICNYCERAFHFPNLLKMHIMFNCYPSKQSSPCPITRACSSTTGRQKCKANDVSIPPDFGIDDLPPRQAEDTRDAMTFKELESCDEEPIEVLKKCFVDLSTKDGHLCVYCGKLYSRKYGLKIHLRTHTGYKPLRCKYCFRAFGDPSNLNKHIRLHSQSVAPYRCELCDKVLARRRDLARHMQSRHPNEC
ncbi:PR domain zinc finger protein 13-like [Dreissena polymorpha]|uniref:PR domain zinc finger protein 13-like n=1 Tax=Dreissena polymorpha TaxID=45954 RepID=UPI002264090D|nr:PR domain zinc finger protein 13-like [Dreissena polymorpha]